MFQRKPLKAQNGVTALAVTVIVLFIISIMVIYAARVGVMDQRMAGNEGRYREAFATAECGLDIATERFNNQFGNKFSPTYPISNVMFNSRICGSNTYAAITGSRQCNDTAQASGSPFFCVDITTIGPSLPPLGSNIFQFNATGTGADQTGTATVSRRLAFQKILGGTAPTVPIIVAGSVGSGGDFNIVANPNGGGPGVPVSIWTKPPSPNGDVSFHSNSAATCHIQYYDGNNAQCSNPASNEIISHGQTNLPAYNSSYPDVLPNDPNFPPDLFQYLFGVPRADWAIIKQKAIEHNQAVSSCAGLGVNAGASFRLWWISGNCNPASNQIIGSVANPVILVIDDHALITQGAGSKIYGIVYLFDNPSTGGTPSADFHGSTEIDGALVSDAGGNAMQGSYSIVYDRQALTNLTIDAGQNYDMTYIPGSWRDY